MSESHDPKSEGHTSRTSSSSAKHEHRDCFTPVTTTVILVRWYVGERSFQLREFAPRFATGDGCCGIPVHARSAKLTAAGNLPDDCGHATYRCPKAPGTKHRPAEIRPILCIHGARVDDCQGYSASSLYGVCSADPK